MDIKIILIGAGGHARVLLDSLGDDFSLVSGALDADTSIKAVEGIPVLGNDSLLANLPNEGYSHFLLGVGSIQDTTLRQRLYQQALDSGLEPFSLLHKNAWVSQKVRQGKGCQILAKTVINTGALLGDNVLINTSVVVEHDCQIGAHVHLATGSILCGGVLVGQGAHIGAGSVIRQGIIIGENALVGIGSVVVKDVPPGGKVWGVPAKSP